MISAAQSIETRLTAAATACARNGAQLTELRRDVLALILGAEGPVTAYQLLDRLRERRRGAVPPTVYRALDFLLAQKLIHRVESLNAFVPCSGGGAHVHAAQFLICARCGAVEELEEAAVTTALQRAAREHGFRPQSMLVEVTGLCAACAQD
jgi:Fur family transcriptional regulator, zinc uptake regulator